MTTLSLLLLAACGGTPAPTGPDPAASAEAAGRLCTLFDRVKRECTYDGPAAKVLGREIDVTAVVVKETKIAGQVILDLRYDLSIDGKPAPALSARSVGTGRSGEDARAQVANDWASVHAAAIADRLVHDGRLGVLQALQDEQEPPKAFLASGWVAYPGWTVLKGAQKKRAVLDIDGLLAVLGPAIEAWTVEPAATHAALVSLTFRSGYAPEGECTLDGEPSTALCDLALRYAWPEPGPSYTIKQYFVFAPGPLPGAP